ncbi:hypothetical protein L596_006619 [Steinernema carpocapsae]|uniref:Uncharacterized protein n=1 Tax=Steinernema carpocapsae TaxID=34508 RepID=A0A4V6I929_STECR|nr:hypothetical protein L596_006619 [Steinernema carpocapsae]
MSYLSPLPHYPALRSRSLSTIDRFYPIDEQCYPLPRPHLHPLYGNPQRYWRVAGGHQPIVTGCDIRPHYISIINSSKPAQPLLDSETLQYAGSRLRKTEHGESLRSNKPNLPDERVAGTNQHLPGRHWQNSSFHEELESIPTGKPLHASTSGAVNAVSFGDLHRYADPVNTYKTTSSSSSYSNTYTSSNNNNNERLTDPRSYIRHFATTTPAYEPTSLSPTAEQFSNQQKRANSQPRSYAHELRDSSLTQTQRYANQFQKSVLPDADSSPLERLKQLKEQEDRKNDHLTSLIRNMEYRMRSGRGAAGEIVCVSGSKAMCEIMLAGGRILARGRRKSGE